MERMKRIRRGIRSKQKIYAVDLFCGAGGLTNGLERAGIDVRLGVDVDPACEYPYATNNTAKFLRKSIEELDWRDVEKVFPKNGIRLLAGCAPCQTFSTYNQKATPDDRRWWLLLHMSRIIQQLSPELITVENVPRLQGQSVFEEFLGSLHDAGYRLFHKVVNCEEYGVPQHRLRLVVLASQLSSIRLISPTEFGADRATVRESIANLPPLMAGEMNLADPLHQSSTLSITNMKRIGASRPGGTWRDWKETLVADCHKKETGKTYPSVYGRMCWDEPAPTITTQFFGFGNGRFGHPEQDRAISLREGAIIQTFPRDYEFTPPGQPIYKKTVGRLIGNAVPTTLGEVIGLSILEHVDLWSRKRENDKTGERTDAGKNTNGVD